MCSNSNTALPSLQQWTPLWFALMCWFPSVVALAEALTEAIQATEEVEEGNGLVVSGLNDVRFELDDLEGSESQLPSFLTEQIYVYLYIYIIFT